MTDIEYKLRDLVNFSSSQKPLEFNDVFNDLIGHRITTAISDKKLHMSQSLVTGSQSDEQELQDTESEEEVNGEAA